MTRPGPLMQAVYIFAILGLFAIVSNGDYQDARRDECSAKSTPKTLVVWDSATDTCKKEERNAKTSKN